ncbi:MULTISPECIES: TetR/AcrR family transcriptional regulator [Sporomusa]|jgi:AcrR family transcriptional regulator|uniref:DNA-binding transcriptional regulator n=1 Tax=Sporomusa sphaeroides DSM 2875 TaxID=1337886 RepID=A0ABP2C556_9FIRM|nr:TetR/AcrR family transcriptional regulator [Sporomusa sphaeroides]MCM0761035.1 TetR/AcrR family transcriptional regulator [Sporomusa sphaeroides DSM 2875]OLS55947.1 HTH-type transcriptional regulator RcdA [Sporomusa sphaeroides DSM 2875]CVK18947.1 putative DNA-binding transcriptional regulator [Sporomusa sphaeroides DSM 2875]HML34664.1 TetR/AcrR family transcriptional regulator [Sporomusa sphaeroides]
MTTHSENKLAIKKKILDATLGIIGAKGAHHVTSRKIATLAEVNVAAINYYFGSKDNAVNEALKTFTDALMQSFDHLDNLAVPPEDRIRNFLRSYADYSLEYPDVFRNFIEQTLHESVSSCEYIEIMKQTGLNKVKAAVREITQNQDEIDLTMKIFQMFSCLELPVLVGDKLQSLAHFDYYDRECRHRYLDWVLKSLLHA